MISLVGAKDMKNVFILTLTESEKENTKTNHESLWMGLNKVPHVEEWARWLHTGQSVASLLCATHSGSVHITLT